MIGDFQNRMNRHRALLLETTGVPAQSAAPVRPATAHAVFKLLSGFFTDASIEVAGHLEFGGTAAYTATSGITLRIGTMDIPPDLAGLEDDADFSEYVALEDWDVIVLTAEPLIPEDDGDEDDDLDEDSPVLLLPAFKSSNVIVVDDPDDDDGDDDDFDDDGWFGPEEMEQTLILGFAPGGSQMLVFCGVLDPEDGEFYGTPHVIDTQGRPARECAAALLRGIMDDDAFFPFSPVLQTLRDLVLSLPPVPEQSPQDKPHKTPRQTPKPK